MEPLPSYEAMIKNFLGQGRLFGRNLPGVQFYEESEESIYYATGLSGGWLNRVGCFDVRPDLIEPLVETVTARYLPYGPSSDWVVATALPHSNRLMNTLESHGWVNYARFMGMLCRNRISPNSRLETHELREVSTDEDLEVWLNIFYLGFSVQTDSFAFARKLYGRAVRDSSFNCRHFVLYSNGEPQSCASVFSASGLSMLYNVATTPHCRSKGAASLLTTLLLARIEAEGVRNHFLFSQSLEVCRFYERLGFERIPSDIVIYYLNRSASSV